MEVFAPEYETYSDIVTNKKVAQSNQKWKGCQIILYFTFRHPTKKLREREKDRERERKNVRSLRGNGCRTGGKVLMSLFLINIIHVVIIIIRFRHPAPPKKPRERDREREGCRTGWKSSDVSLFHVVIMVIISSFLIPRSFRRTQFCPSPLGRCPGPARDIGGAPIPHQYRALSIINTWGAFHLTGKTGIASITSVADIGKRVARWRFW